MPAKSLSKLKKDELLRKKTATLLEHALLSSEISNKLHNFNVEGFMRIDVDSKGFLIKLSRAGDRTFAWSFSHKRGVGRPRTTEINGVKVPFQKFKPIKGNFGLKTSSPTNMDRILNTIVAHLSFVFPLFPINLYLELNNEYDPDFEWKRALTGLIVHNLTLKGNGDEGFEQVMKNIRVNERIENNCTFKKNKFEKSFKLLQQPQIIWCRSAGWLNLKTLPALRAGHMRFIMKRLDDNWIKSFFQHWTRSKNRDVDRIKAVVFVHPDRSAAALAKLERFLWNDLRGQRWNGPRGDHLRETGTNLIVDCRYSIVIRRKHLSGMVATFGDRHTAIVME